MNYQAAKALLGTRDTKLLTANTYLIYRNQHTITVHLYDTPILSLMDDGSVTYESDTYRTALTRRRMNEYGLDNWRIVQFGKQWYAKRKGTKEAIPYFDGIRLKGDHVVNPDSSLNLNAEV